jgi:hypothetical protein
VSFVDESWVIGIRQLDEFAGGIGATGVQGYGHDLKTLGIQLPPEFLPPGQVVSTSSP